jgi:Domain of unknown function (DUF4157)
MFSPKLVKRRTKSKEESRSTAALRRSLRPGQHLGPGSTGPMSARTTAHVGTHALMSTQGPTGVSVRQQFDHAVGWRAAVRQAAERPGRPLDPQLQPDRGGGPAAFGIDYRAVRVHTDAASGEAANRLGARAFTVGSHIFFARGEYPPAGPEGMKLLTHELTHTAENPSTPVSDAWKLPVSAPTDASERAATEAATNPGKRSRNRSGRASSPAIRRVLAAYASPHEEILPTMGDSPWVPTVSATADSARIRAALMPLIAVGKIEIATVDDRDFFSLPANGAATSAEVLRAFSTAGFARAIDMTAVLMDRHNAKLFAAEELYELQGLWSQTVSRDRNVIRQTERPLTAEEATEAKLVFGTGLNYSAIRITEDPVWGAGNTARTIPSVINFPVGASTTSSYLPWLIHELTHSWQYQHGRSVAATATRALLCWAHLSSYQYGGKPALQAAAAAGKGLSAFSTEQQGEIARNYYLDLTYKNGVAEYAPFLAEFRTPP